MGGGDGANGTQGKARLEVGTRARTLNMPAMLVTLDVTTSSGLLKFFVFCRVAGRGHMKQGEGWTGRRECGRRVGRQQAVDEAAFARSVQKRARLQIGSRARGGAHGEHVLHGCDAGGVEAQRLVERLSALPRAERSAYDAAAGCGPARWWCKPHAGRSSAGGHQKARTLNISSMLVTLDVTKFSGLLNLFAFCRVAGRGIRSGATCRPRGERAVGGCGVGGMQGRARVEAGRGQAP